MDKFWQRWNSRFFNKTRKPSNIDGLTDDTAIANHFSDCFAWVYFDSYENNVNVVACLEKLQSVAMIEKGSTGHKCCKLIIRLNYLGVYFSGPRNSFYCLGHFKNVYDDDDDDELIVWQWIWVKMS